MEKELPVRKKIRLEGYDYSSAGYYFITICVKDRHEILGRIVGDAHQGVPHIELNEIGRMVEQYINNIPKHYDNVKINKYIVMTNHIHMIVIINNGTPGCKGIKKPNREKPAYH